MSSDILRRRAEIEDAIAGRTLCDELRHVAETAGDAYAYSDEAAAAADAGWRSLTWSQARQRVLETAAGFAALGLAPGERVALTVPNPHAQAQAPGRAHQVRQRHRLPLRRVIPVRCLAR